MDIKNSAITAKMVIHSLLALLENENVDISSVKFKVGSDGNGYESPEFELEKLVSLAIDGLVEIEEANAVPEGFVLVPEVISDEWMEVFVEQKLSEYCKSYEELPFSVKDEELPDLREDFRLPIRNAHKRLMLVIEAKEKSHDSKNP
jgi:hypothetical protein